MTPQQAEEYIRRKAAEHNVPASEALSLWAQESGRSLDTGLKGAFLPRHNDYARGPFQVVPKFHPKFPVGGTFEEQADYAIPFYASGGPTMEDRTRRYYGSGTPMKGQPTLAQYQSQVRSRMTDAPAGNMQDPPPQEQTMQYQIEDPEELLRRTRDSYRPQYQERARYEDPYEGVTYQPREQGFLERWLTNPLTQGGIAMLAANSSDPLANIGYGLQVAGAAYGQRNQADNELLDLQMKRAEARRKAKRETALENRDIDKSNRELYQQDQLLRYADSIEATDPRTAAMIRAGITSGVSVPTSFAPQTYKRGDDYVEVTFDNRGGRSERVLPKGTVPFNADIKTADRQGEIAYAQGYGGATGKGRGETENTQTTDVKKAIDIQPILADIERVLPQSTGSGAGALVDQAGRFIGYDTSGAKAIAELQVLGNKLIQNVPRFEGPQSDRDVELYKQAAGDLANPSTTVPERQAALQRIKDLYARTRAKGYPANQNAQPTTAAPAGGGWRVVR